MRVAAYQANGYDANGYEPAYGRTQYPDAAPAGREDDPLRR